jgi:hypothetical protein
MSKQVAASQRLLVASQIMLSQSPLTLHRPVGPQGAQFGPPQSVSVSLTFFVPSWHPGSTHTCCAASQLCDAQSLNALQLMPNTQGVHLAPQSGPDSLPLVT